MANEKDWNKIFAERKAARDVERSQILSNAKAKAAGTNKEPFSVGKFKKLYIQLNPDDVDKHSPWNTLLQEAEYDYYVTQSDKTTLEDFVKHMKWLQGWG